MPGRSLVPRLISEALLLPRTRLPAALHAPRTSNACVLSTPLCHLQKRSLGALPCPQRLHRTHSTSQTQAAVTGTSVPMPGLCNRRPFWVEGWAGKVTLTPYDGNKSSGHVVIG